MAGAADLWAATLKLMLACLLGGIVGWQRETRDQPAGLRTHMLVCVGSCLVMLVSIGAATTNGTLIARADPGRIAAQVVSGIGFLGAGTILRQGSGVRGLTTAASLWTVAAIGLAIGLGRGFGIIATIATLLVLATLAIFGRVETVLIARRQAHDLRIVLPRDQVSTLMRLLAERGVNTRRVESIPPYEEDIQRLRLSLRIPPRVSVEQITRELTVLPNVREIDWD